MHLTAFPEWLESTGTNDSVRWILSLQPTSQTFRSLGSLPSE
jgi:hypothetical protein